jgi:hypothetical protein
MRVKPIGVSQSVPRPPQTGGETAHTAMFGSQLYDIYMAKLSDSECQILSLVIIPAHQTGCTIHLRGAMNVVDESNLLSGGHGNTRGTTGPCTATMFVPGPMELGLISQSNACARCGVRHHWSYFCATPKDWKEGDPIQKLDFNKAKRRGEEKDNGEKGHGRHG